MLSIEALNLFAQLLSGVRLEANDPDLVAKAELVSRVRKEVLDSLNSQQIEK